MFRFLHAADLHLDTPFLSVGAQLPEPFAALLRDASLRAFDSLVQRAIDHDVAFVLLAGDIYDGAQRGLRAQRRFLAGVQRLDAAGIRTFIVHGNHDPVGEGWSAIDQWPALVHVFSAADPHAVAFAAGGEQVTVHGISYAQRHTTENLALRFPAHAGPGVHIGLLHANVSASTGHEPYSPATVAELASRGIDYWALGHVHTRQVVHAGHPWVVYPGNVQGRSIRASEQGAKGAVIVTVDHGHLSAPRFVPLDLVRFVSVEVDIAHERSVPALLDRLEHQAHPSSHDGRSLIVRATIGGAGPLHHELADPLRRAEVLRALRDQVETFGEPYVWFDQLDWQTRPELDLATLRQGHGFVADLLAIAEDPQAPTTFVPAVPAELARILGDATIAEDCDRDVYERALVLALDHLHGGAS
jgi:exonuclease SbcD